MADALRELAAPMTEPEVIGRALSPAKVNFGLAVLGKRADGYHDIRSTMQAISLFDRISMIAPGRGEVRSDDSRLDPESNLMSVAARELAERIEAPLDVDFMLTKRIPFASGLGGGSSNAAAVLRLLCRHWSIDLSDERVAAAALATGSDVPFFLRGGPARVSGRGERIDPLPRLPALWLVLVVPSLTLEDKTARLFRALRESDFQPGGSPAIQDSVPACADNAFERPLYELYPEIASIGSTLAHRTREKVRLSGAGPAHYVAFDRSDVAYDLIRSISRDDQFGACAIHLARTIVGPGPLDMRRNTAQ
ncbi:MAG: 4-(cytidine 5'-diphospho)-2-C-methyl-D-erythritol kinase [Thermomicrobiales bacterium]